MLPIHSHHHHDAHNLESNSSLIIIPLGTCYRESSKLRYPCIIQARPPSCRERTYGLARVDYDRDMAERPINNRIRRTVMDLKTETQKNSTDIWEEWGGRGCAWLGDGHHVAAISGSRLDLQFCRCRFFSMNHPSELEYTIVETARTE